jgi:hypothetical protein
LRIRSKRRRNYDPFKRVRTRRRMAAGVVVATATSLVMALTPTALASNGAIDSGASPFNENDAAAFARDDLCQLGYILHFGGTATKAAVQNVLLGSDQQRSEALAGWRYGIGPVGEAVQHDGDPTIASAARLARNDEWGVKRDYLIKLPYSGLDLDTEVKHFDTAEKDLYADGRTFQWTLLAPKASPEAIAKAEAVVDATHTDDIVAYFRRYGIGTSADDIRRILQYGGFPRSAPAAGTAEFRMDVEALKARWASCDSSSPSDPFQVLREEVAVSAAEWRAELDSQASQRAAVVAAEVQSAKDLWAVNDLLYKSMGEAWYAGELTRFVTYWDAVSGSTDSWGRPKPVAAVAGARAELTASRQRTEAMLVSAKQLAASAATQASNTTAAQASAAQVAKTNGTPVGRGLAFAQQSAQVAKASAAAVKAASLAIETARNATNATVANGQALVALAQTQAAAVEAEFRRAAAEEAAAQAKSAAESAASHALSAAQAADQAASLRVKAETAEQNAKVAADDAQAKRGVADSERANAAAAKARSESERAKAQAAEARAESGRHTAATERGKAESAAATAATRRGEAEAAEGRAAQARDAAVAAERDRDATEARAQALESAAAAAESTAYAGETRAAATEARTAATAATAAATNARDAANQAGSAAVAARKAATEADGAAARAKAASDGAWADAATAQSEAATAHAAAATAITAAKTAADHAEGADTDAHTANDAAAKARTEATATQTSADEASRTSALTAGRAFAASTAATAARDTAKAVVDPANKAIALGKPYAETDTSAGLAVLVGQAAKSFAEKQAAVAEAKSDEAAKAAAAAKALADQAQADGKAAAQASANAAADAAKAAQSAAAAQASATRAGNEAKAATQAESNAVGHVARAVEAAWYADAAATDARTDATLANNNATEAERDAASAQSAATAAEQDASSARNTATKAETDATAAEAAAANAQNSAQEAQQAAQRAEEQRRQEEEAANKAVLAQQNPAPDLSVDEGQALWLACGNECRTDYQAAQVAAKADIGSWLIEEGVDILLDYVGVDDIKGCLGKGEIEKCLLSIVDLGAIVSVFLKPEKVVAASKAIAKVASKAPKFLAAIKTARKKVEDIRYVAARVVTELMRDYATWSFLKFSDGNGKLDGTMRQDNKPCVPGDPKYKDRTGPANNRAVEGYICMNKASVKPDQGSSPSVDTAGYNWAMAYIRWVAGVGGGDRNRCHLIPAQFGGAGDDDRNLATCTRAANTNVQGPPGRAINMYTVETWAKEAVDRGLTVEYVVRPEYVGDRTVPAGFRMEITGWDDNGVQQYHMYQFVRDEFYNPTWQDTNANLAVEWPNLGMAVDSRTREAVPTGTTA